MPKWDLPDPAHLAHCIPDNQIVHFEVAPEAEKAPIQEVEIEETPEYKALLIKKGALELAKALLEDEKARLTAEKLELSKEKEKLEREKNQCIEDREQLKGEKSRLLERVTELENKGCLYEQWADYVAAGKNGIDINLWKEQYNLQNLWRLTKEEFEDLILIIPFLYKLNKHRELRTVVEKCFQRRSAFNYDTGVSVTGTPPRDIINITQAAAKYYRYEAQALFQTVRASWDAIARNATYVKAFNNLVNYGSKLTSETIKDEARFLELGQKTQAFWNVVIPNNLRWLYNDLVAKKIR